MNHFHQRDFGRWNKSNLSEFWTVIFSKLTINLFVEFFVFLAIGSFMLNECYDINITIREIKSSGEWSKGEYLGLRVKWDDDSFDLCKDWHSFLMLLFWRFDVKVKGFNFLMETNDWVFNGFDFFIKPWENLRLL